MTGLSFTQGYPSLITASRASIACQLLRCWSTASAVATLNLSNLDPSQRQYAELIAENFAKTGYRRGQQAAAVADAIAASSHDPTTVDDEGHSMGLFRENREGGRETGYSVASLENPQTNIRIALDAALGHAKTIDGAASAFVDDVVTLRH